MKRAKLIIILIAVVCVVIGCVIMGVGFALSGFDLKSLSTMEYVDKTYDVTMDFSKIDIRTFEENVVFAVSADGKCKIEACVSSKTDVNLSVSGGMLTVRTTDNRKWYERISIEWDAEPVLKVYLPKLQ